MNKSEFQSKILDAFGPIVGAALMKVVLPTAHMTLEAVELDSIPLGASRYGGDPDVPAGFKWPTCATRQGHKPPGHVYPLTFVAQINFAEAASCLADDPIWPRDGTLLYFFDCVCMPNGLYDPADATGLRLVYVPAGTPLTRVQAPSHTAPTPCDASKFVLSARRITFAPGWSLSRELAHPLLGKLYNEAWWQKTFVSNCPARHRLGGYAVPEQGDPCFYDGGAYDEGRTGWRLLLQFDLVAEEEDPHGYEGTQYFLCCREDGIKTRTFKPAMWIWDQD